MNWKAQKIIKILIPAVIFLFLGWQVFRDWSQISGYLLAIKFHYLLLAFPVFLLIYPEGAFCWWLILQKMRVNVSVAEALRIWIIANTSRYIPGIIWQYLGRVELGKREVGIKRSKTIISLLLEAFLILMAAGLVSIFALPFITSQTLERRFIIFLLPLFLVLFHPKVANLIIFLIAKFSKNKVNIYYPLNFSQALSIFPFYMLNFLLNGLALFLLIISIYGDFIISPYQIFLFSGFYAFSWAVGFLSFFAPGGLGVTEITLSYLLSFFLPLSIASSITLLYRFLLTIGEVLVFVFVLRIGGSKSEEKH